MVSLTTSNQKFLNFFHGSARTKFSLNHSKKFNLFLLIVNELSRHKVLFSQKKIIAFRQLFFTQHEYIF
jgi:hypothetical protein